jgi:hypothetical protein
VGVEDAGAPAPGRTYLAVSDDGAVRGAIALHPQRYRVAGEEREVVNVQFPVSRGCSTGSTLTSAPGC